jgi:hypothetical protein
MEIVNVRNARSVWLFDPRDLNPRGLSPVPFLSAIKDRYHFLGWPRTPEELSWTTASPKGIKFTDGAFSIDDQTYSISVALYNDGVVADTGSSTTHSDAFLGDLLSFGAQHFGVDYHPEIVYRKQHHSELLVRTGHDLNETCDKIARLAARFSAIVGDGPPFQWFGLELRRDPSTVSGPVIPSFKLEREAGRTPSEGRYYSSAPLRTEAHEQLLRDFESIMAEQSSPP